MSDSIPSDDLPPTDDVTSEARDLQPILGDMLSHAMRRLLRRGRSELSRAAEASRAQLALRRQQADLAHFWVRLGKTAYHLVKAGEIDHPALRKAMRRIDELEGEIDASRASRSRDEPLPPGEATVRAAPPEGL